MSFELECKEVAEEPGVVWVVLTGKGNVPIDEIKKKMAKLQEILDYVREYKPESQFGFLFDFSTCIDFKKMEMLEDIKAFLTKNDALIESRLNRTYVLLRLPVWKLFLNIIFFFRPPTKPCHLNKIEADLYRAIKHSTQLMKGSFIKKNVVK